MHGSNDKDSVGSRIAPPLDVLVVPERLLARARKILGLPEVEQVEKRFNKTLQ